MSVMTDVQSIAANTTIQNIVAGKLHEFLPEDSIVTVGISADTVGVNGTVLIGGESVAQDQEVSNSNRHPVMPDDIFAQGGGFGGDRLIISLRNTTGAAIVVKSMITVEPA